MSKTVCWWWPGSCRRTCRPTFAELQIGQWPERHGGEHSPVQIMRLCLVFLCLRFSVRVWLCFSIALSLQLVTSFLSFLCSVSLLFAVMTLHQTSSIIKLRGECTLWSVELDRWGAPRNVAGAPHSWTEKQMAMAKQHSVNAMHVNAQWKLINWGYDAYEWI